MRRLLFLVAFALPLLAVAQVIAPGTTLTCNQDVPVAMVTSVNSQQGYSGQVFQFQVTQTTTSDDLVFPQGSVGYGVVRDSVPASNRGRDGVIILEPRFIVVGGSQIAVSGDPRYPSVLTKGTNPLAQGAGMIPVPGVGWLLNEAIKGTDTTIGPGYKFYVIPLGDLTRQAPCAQK